jgi:hypothetical protein
MSTESREMSNMAEPQKLHPTPPQPTNFEARICVNLEHRCRYRLLATTSAPYSMAQQWAGGIVRQDTHSMGTRGRKRRLGHIDAFTRRKANYTEVCTNKEMIGVSTPDGMIWMCCDMLSHELTRRSYLLFGLTSRKDLRRNTVKKSTAPDLFVLYLQVSARFLSIFTGNHT